MGFLKKLLNGVLAFVAGIIGFLTGLLGIKKSEYYMEYKGDLTDNQGTRTATKTPITESEPVQPALVPAETAQIVKVEPTPPPVPVATSVPAPAPAEPVKPAKSAVTAPAAPPASTSTTFAPTFLTPGTSTSNRRMPGANMGDFMRMAKQIKSSS